MAKPLRSEISTIYEESEFWKQETFLSPVDTWTTESLQSWIKSQVLHSNKSPKYNDVLQKIQRVLCEEEIDGTLLLAGGKNYLMEKSSLVVTKKADRMRLDRAVSLIFASIQKAKELTGYVSYWDRLETESAGGKSVHQEFSQNDGTRLGDLLRFAMTPQPLARIEYSASNHLDSASNVTDADQYVSKLVNASDSHMFKVVSIAPRESSSTVWSNLIYVRSDAEESKTGSSSLQAASEHLLSRKQKRAIKRKKVPGSLWVLIASVDFAQHGSAKPGHWHLNTSFSGDREDLSPHMQVSVSETSRETWHGSEDGCPLWWNFIPAGMTYKMEPHRISSLTNKHQ